MSTADPAELKKFLRNLGFEVYRTVAGQVTLAERVRDNLIMDSGIAVGPGASPEQEGQWLVSVTVRAQASHFPGASADQVRAEARALAQHLFERGYSEAAFEGKSMMDPSDPELVLDTSHELRVARMVDEAALAEEIKHLLGIRRASTDD